MMPRILVASGLYFLIVFGTGLLLGPIRVFWLEPRIGPLAAVLCEAPFLLVAIVVAARAAPRAAQLAPGVNGLLCVGVLALAMQQIADITVGLTLRGISLRDQFFRFATAQGVVYAALLILFAVMPVLVNRPSRS